MKKYIGIIISFAMIFVLTSCGYKQFNDKTDYEKVSITHTVSKPVVNSEDFNRVEVTEEFYVNPKKVVTFSWGVADVLSYFGIEELGIEILGLPTEQSNIPNLIKELNDVNYEDAGTLHVINYEKMKLLNPDLIILDGRTSSQYETIKDMFPYTNILDASSTNYNYENQKVIYNNLGEIFPDISEELNEKLTTFETSFNEVKELAKDFRASVIMLNGNKKTYQKGAASRYGVVFREFGFVEAASEDTKYDDITSHGHEITLEFISDINPEVIFLLDRNMVTNNQESDREFLKESIIADVDAVKNEYIFNLNPEAWYTVTGGIRATEQMIEDVYAFVNTLNDNNA